MKDPSHLLLMLLVAVEGTLNTMKCKRGPTAPSTKTVVDEKGAWAAYAPCDCSNCVAVRKLNTTLELVRVSILETP